MKTKQITSATTAPLLIRANSPKLKVRQHQKQIEPVMGVTVGMYGDLRGIAGQSLQEIEGLELSALEMKP